MMSFQFKWVIIKSFGIKDTDVEKFVSSNPTKVDAEKCFFTKYHISFPDLSLGEDQFFLMRLLLTTSQIQFSSLIFYVYRSEIEGNLTSNKAKILDLSRNLELEISYLRAINSRNTVITNMLFRQIVTLFKRGSIRLKLYAVLICIRLFLLHSPSEVLSVMKFAVLIIKGHN